MKNPLFISYQGNKNSIIDFITDSIDSLNLNDGKVLDIFSGSGAVSVELLKKYDVISNDAEPYAATISSAISSSYKLHSEKFDIDEFLAATDLAINNLIETEGIERLIQVEAIALEKRDLITIITLYQDFATVWNNSDIYKPSKMRATQRYNLFTRYYAGTYFGIQQAVEIDAIIKTIHKNTHNNLQKILLACLFYAMKETVYSRDGHMAQPLQFQNNATRGFNTRAKSVKNYFAKKLEEMIELGKQQIFTHHHEVHNKTLQDLLLDETLIASVDVIYADPPYTDMQYSRYYHLLNVAVNYNFPELTKNGNKFTSGLYTEGRFQSPLSQKSGAKKNLSSLIKTSKKYNKTLILSYAYPKNHEEQQTSRYTISIKELIEICSNVYGSSNIEVRERDYLHANHRNSQSKPVVEYLILCKSSIEARRDLFDISQLNKKISNIQPTNRNTYYNTHLYWSQKAFNITNYLINELTAAHDVVFDPFLGSGVTVLEAVKQGVDRCAVGCDVNEMPLFITKTLLDYALDKKSLKDLQDLSQRLEQHKNLYLTKCENCNKEVVIDKVVFDKPARNTDKIIPTQVIFACQCGNKNNVSSKFTKIAVKNMYSSYDFFHIDTAYPLLKNSKAGVADGDTLSSLFTKRNLKALDIILDISQSYSKNSQNLIKYVINSMLHQCKITDLRSNSQWLLWTPKKDCVERNVFNLMQAKLKKFLAAQASIEENFGKSSIVDSFSNLSPNKALLFRKGSQHISERDLPENSVDLIITDPPYLDQVLYSEYMQLYKPIVGLDYNFKDEIVVSSGKGRNKTRDSYYTALKEVFLICGSKLKENKLLCLYFHDSNLDVWVHLVDSLCLAGFEFIGQTHIKKNMTLKNIISPKKSLNGDSILFFRNTKVAIKHPNNQESLDVIKHNILKEAKHMIASKGALSTPELYDLGLMTILIQNGWLKTLSASYKSLVEIFEESLIWDSYAAKWINPPDPITQNK